MPYTIEDFRRDYVKEHHLTEEELGILSLQKRLAGLSPEERLKGLCTEEIEQYLERRKKQKPTAPRAGKEKPKIRRQRQR